MSVDERRLLRMRKPISDSLFQHVLAHHGKYTIFVSAFILLFGIGYSIFLGDSLRFADEKQYYTLAKNLADTGAYSLDGVNPTAYRPPGYPFLLTVFLYLLDRIEFLRSINFVLLSLSFYLWSRIALLLGNPLSAVIMLLGVFYYPVLIFTAGTLYPQTLAFFLMSLFCYIIFVVKIRSVVTSCLSGLIYGFLGLTVPLFLIICGPFVVYMLRDQIKPKFVLYFVVVAAVCIGGWSARNYVVMGHFIPFSTNGGINLLLGNSPRTTPNAGVNVDISAYRSETVGMGEYERDRYYLRSAVEWIRDNPKEFVKLYIRKFLNWFNFRNILATKSQSAFWKNAIMFISYYSILIYVCIRLGFYRSYPLRREEISILSTYVVAAAIYAMFFTRIRFRVPFDPFLLASTSIFLGEVVWRKLGRSRSAQGG